MSEATINEVVSPAVDHTNHSAENITLREQLWLNPSLVWLRSGKTKANALANAAKEDMVDSPMGVMVPAASVAAMGLTQALDRIRIVVKEAPPHAIDAMKDMDFTKPSTLVAGAIVAGAFAVWNFTAGEVLNRTIDQFPKTTEKFVETFPRVVKAAEYAIPNEIKEFNEQRAFSDTKVERGTLGKKLKRGLKRGWSAFSFGSTIHMGVAAINGIPANQRTKINTEVSRDGAIFSMAPVTLAIAEIVRRNVTGGDPERAATVLSWAQDKSNWDVVAATVMGTTVGLNYLARRKAGKELEPDATESSVIDLDPVQK